MRIAVLLTLALTGCSGSTTEEPVTFAHPSDASEVQRFPRGTMGGHQDYFVLERQYPAADVIDHYGKILASWTECSWARHGWDGFPDSTGDVRRYVHRVARFWIRKDDKAMVTVFARYHSEYAMCRDAPDNDRQEVFVLYDPIPNARAVAETIGVKCDTTPNSSIQSGWVRSTVTARWSCGRSAADFRH